MGTERLLPSPSHLAPAHTPSLSPPLLSPVLLIVLPSTSPTIFLLSCTLSSSYLALIIAHTHTAPFPSHLLHAICAHYPHRLAHMRTPCAGMYHKLRHHCCCAQSLVAWLCLPVSDANPPCMTLLGCPLATTLLRSLLLPSCFQLTSQQRKRRGEKTPQLTDEK